MRNEKNWSKEFLEYMDFIAENKNYDGLAIKKDDKGNLKWIASAKSEIGKQRIEWAKNKGKQLNINENTPGFYAKVMFKIHPTKEKPCQICGKTMSLYYLYPNANLLKAIKKRFSLEFQDTEKITFIYNEICKKFDKNIVFSFFKETFNTPYARDFAELIKNYEEKCRNGDGKLLGPGAMSNFPDRFDGFHTYNRCCRSKEDSGRSKENLKSYGKDRRAYEYWSDGNFRAANEFMYSSFFNGTSADHIGPLSLGFIHDSLILRKLAVGDNSSKRNKLLQKDVDELISIENKNNICVMSWYSKSIWEFLKQEYLKNKQNFNFLIFYNAFLKNRNNYMNLLAYLKNHSNNGREFLIKALLEPKIDCFKWNYSFNSLGEIVSKKPRNENNANKKEVSRFYRIALESLDDYCHKENRHLKSDVTITYKKSLDDIIRRIDKKEYTESLHLLNNLVRIIENEIILKIKNHEDF